jgi:hypothetical protein
MRTALFAPYPPGIVGGRAAHVLDARNENRFQSGQTLDIGRTEARTQVKEVGMLR